MIRPESIDRTYCKNILPVLDDFLADELSEETSSEIKSHLKICSLCRGEFETRQEIRVALQKSWQSLQVPHGLKSKITRQTGLSPSYQSPLKIAAGIIIFGIVILTFN